MSINDDIVCLLNENYHRRKDFNDSINEIAEKIVTIVEAGCNMALGNDESKDFFKSIKGKSIRTGYRVLLDIEDVKQINRSTKFKIELEKSTKEDNQIVLDIVYDEIEWLFSCSLRKITETDYNIVISCNMMTLCNNFFELYSI